MKISIWGVNPERAMPLACVLRSYGRHSVVMYGGTFRETPDPEVRRLWEDPVPMPTAAQPSWALREGSDLAIIASGYPHISLKMLSRAAHELGLENVPTVVCTPFGYIAPIAYRPPRLAVGHAPFDYRPERALERLLTLQRIRVCSALPGDVELLRQAVSQAWAWVDNHVQVEMTFPAGV